MTMRRLLVNSHVSSTRARDRLLDSLARNPDWERFEVLVVVGGAVSNQTQTVGNVTWIEVTHNSIDWTALIEMIGRQPPDDEYMYVHDTCEVGPDFFDRAWRAPLIGMTARIRRRTHKSMNMGLYKQRWIDDHATLLRSFRNDGGDLQACKERCIRSEDVLFDMDPANTVIGSGIAEIERARDVYGNGVPRITETYPDVSLRKFKANWTMRPRYCLLN